VRKELGLEILKVFSFQQLSGIFRGILWLVPWRNEQESFMEGLKRFGRHNAYRSYCLILSYERSLLLDSVFVRDQLLSVAHIQLVREISSLLFIPYDHKKAVIKELLIISFFCSFTIMRWKTKNYYLLICCSYGDFLKEICTVLHDKRRRKKIRKENTIILLVIRDLFSLYLNLIP